MSLSMVSKCMVGYERERENSSCPVDRGRYEGEGSEEWADLGNLHATQGHGAFQAELQPMAMSVPMGPPQLWLC